MAVGVFKLSQSQRFRLALIFNTLNVLQIFLGLSITSTSVYIYVSVSPILYSERAEVNFVFVVTGIYGTHIILNYLLGFKISRKCVIQAHKKSTSGLLLVWICAGSISVLNLLIISGMLRKISKHMIRSMKRSLQHAISNYLIDKQWKRIIDQLQIDMECCGVLEYKDWYEHSWLTKYHINQSSEIVTKFKENQKLDLQILPWSCCNLNFPMQCLHDPIQQAQSAHIWKDEPNLVLSSINTKGCLNFIRKPIETAVVLFILTTVLIFFVHISIFLISRILYTSSRNAILLETPTGVAPGWIFGRGDFGYSGGKTIAELMAEDVPSVPASDKTDVAPTEMTEMESVEKKSKSMRKSRKFYKSRKNKTDYSETNPSPTDEENPKSNKSKKKKMKDRVPLLKQNRKKPKTHK